jgi:hypothetical protein
LVEISFLMSTKQLEIVDEEEEEEVRYIYWHEPVEEVKPPVMVSVATQTE